MVSAQNGQLLPSSPKLGFGASVTPAYDGWYDNADGTHTFLIGYYNRNWEQEVDIPIGPNNHFEPGDRRPRSADALPAEPQLRHVHRHGAEELPAPTTHLWWVLTINGVTSRVGMILSPDYNITPQKSSEESPNGKYNEPPVLRFTDGAPAIKNPVANLATAATRTATVGQPMPIDLLVEDDALYTSGTNAPMARMPALVKAAVSKYRGPGAVTVKGFDKFTTTKGGELMEPYAGKAHGDGDVQRAWRLHGARDHQRSLRQGRRRIGLLLDDRDGEGQRESGNQHRPLIDRTCRVRLPPDAVARRAGESRSGKSPALPPSAYCLSSPAPRPIAAREKSRTRGKFRRSLQECADFAPFAAVFTRHSSCTMRRRRAAAHGHAHPSHAIVHLLKRSRMMPGSKLHLGAGALVAGVFLAVPGAALAQQATARQVTFSKDVAPIFQAKCQSCHEPGSIAPMSLMTYQEARPWAKSIRERVASRQMPPWHIDRSVGVQKFKNDMSLTDEQVDTIVAWVDQGALEGNPGRLAAAKPVDDQALLAGRARRLRPARPRREVAGLHDAGRAPGPVVAADRRHSGSPSRAGCGWSKSVRPTSRAARSCITRSPITILEPGQRRRGQHGHAVGRSRPAAADAHDLVNRRPQLMEWAIGKGYDRYPDGTAS